MKSVSIVRGVVRKGSADNLVRPVQQIEYMEKVCESEIFFPYGLHANLPPMANVITFGVLGQASNKVSFGNFTNKRMSLKVGEVIFYHPLKGAYIHMKNNGEISMKTGSTTLVMKPNAKAVFTGDLDIIGKLDVTGDTDVHGTMTGGAVKTEAGIDLDTHDHESGTYVAGPIPVSGKSGLPT